MQTNTAKWSLPSLPVYVLYIFCESSFMYYFLENFSEKLLLLIILFTSAKLMKKNFIIKKKKNIDNMQEIIIETPLDSPKKTCILEKEEEPEWKQWIWT